MKLISGFGYKVTYTDKTSKIFQVLDTTEDGRMRFRLCDGQEVFNILSRPYMELMELGGNSPCGQN